MNEQAGEQGDTEGTPARGRLARLVWPQTPSGQARRAARRGCCRGHRISQYSNDQAIARPKRAADLI